MIFFNKHQKLDFELIALNSPFDKKNEFFEFKLMDKGKPLGNFQITIFSKTRENFTQEIIKNEAKWRRKNKGF
jgi:uncharacterized GH25 family protein